MPVQNKLGTGAGDDFFEGGRIGAFDARTRYLVRTLNPDAPMDIQQRKTAR